jgi:5-(aminomethyl)-3-furanmethanol phosphate kinase
MIDTVVKLGGGLVAHLAHLDAALATIKDVTRKRRLLVVPGGGPFADAVREVDRRLRLSDDAAHWMAILAMDQVAHLIAARLADSVRVCDRVEIAAAFDGSGNATTIPILAPYRWLREADPLPHSWDVTSDSIAAWVAGQVGARQLILLKPPGATGRELVDAYFPHALPADVRAVIVPADQLDTLRLALSG